MLTKRANGRSPESSGPLWSCRFASGRMVPTPTHPSAPRVEHHGQVQPAHPGRDLRDVGDAEPGWVLRLGSPGSLGRCGRGVGVLLRRVRLETSARHALDVQLPHQPTTRLWLNRSPSATSAAWIRGQP